MVTSPTASSPAGMSNGPPQPKRRKDQELQSEPTSKSVGEVNHEKQRPTTTSSNSQPPVPKQPAKRPPPPRKLPEKKPPLPSVQPDPEQAGADDDVSVLESPKAVQHPSQQPPVKRAPPPLPQLRPAVESPDIVVSQMAISSSLIIRGIVWDYCLGGMRLG